MSNMYGRARLRDESYFSHRMGDPGRSAGRFCRAAALAASMAVALILPMASSAQNNAAPARVTSQINESNMTTLRGNTHPLARPQYDRGAVADSQPMRRMLLLLQRSPAQEASLRSLIDQQQSKASPNYHQWLTPQQFGQQFGPANTDIQTITDWLTSHGFQVVNVSAGRTLIEFSGNAGQVRDAFHTEIHRYVVNGQEHLANASDPQIPAALASVVVGPVSLHNFRRRALHKVGGMITASPQANGVKPALSTTCNSGGGTPNFACYVVAPADFATIYNSEALWNSTTPVPAGIDGTGQIIAIVGDSNINCEDVTNFRNFFGLPVSTASSNNDCTQATSNVQVILDGPDPGLNNNNDEVEADLDVEWSGAVAKGAHIDFVASQDTDVSLGIDLSAEYIIDNNLAPVMSESFGDCEANLLNGGNSFYSTLWEQAAAQGITAIVSAGDSGAASCDDDNFTTVSANGLAVSGLASTPFNVAVGGTDFNDFTNQTTYWNSSNTNATTQESVKGYVPEIPWDDSCASSAVTGCNGVSISSGPASLNIVAAGGGESNCVNSVQLTVGTACDVILGTNVTGYPKPAWQSGKAVTGLASTDGVRDLPDVSLFAAAGSGSNSFYPICESDAGALCTDGTFIGVGGTSSSAPAFAGIMAMVNQYMAAESLPSRQGNANYVLYSLASAQVTAATSCNSTSNPNTANGGCTFYDITQGSNSVPCVTGLGCTIQNTNANTPGLLEEVNSLGNTNGTLAWEAGTGYDLSTGLGSINAYNLVHNWPAAVGLFTPTTTTLQLCTGSPQVCVSGGSASTLSFHHGAQVFVNAVVAPSPGTGTDTKGEDIALIGTPNTLANNGGSATAAVDRFSATDGNVDIYTLTNGSTSDNSTAFLTGGIYAITAHYTGDGTFGASDSAAVNVDVSAENSTTTLTFAGAVDPSTGNLVNSTAYGLPDLFRVDVVGATSGEETATGSVTLTDNGALFGGNGCCTLNSEGHLDLEPGFNQIPTLSTTTHVFHASYLGDAGYAASASNTLSFTVTPATTSTIVASNPATASSGQSVVLTATVSTDSIGLSPGGTVTFFANGVAISAGAVSYTRTNGSFQGFQSAGVVATLGYSPTATTTITAMYSTGADSNYLSSAVSSPVTIDVTSAATFSISSPNTSPGNPVVITAPGGTGSANLTITSLNSFAGTITLSCSVGPVGDNDEPSCSFPGGNSVTLTANGAKAQTVALSTTASSSLLPNSNSARGPGPKSLLNLVRSPIAWIFALTFAIVLVPTFVRTTERWRSYAVLAVLLVLATLAAVACGSSGGGGGNSNTGTTTGTYVVSVSGTSGSTSGTPVTVYFNLE